MSRLRTDAAGAPEAAAPAGQAGTAAAARTDPAAVAAAAAPAGAAGSAWAARLAECCGRVAVALGIRDRPEAVARELAGLLDEPAALYASHPNWPSAMTVLGPPVEISLRLDWGRPAALRLVVDVTDHRAGFAANWPRYLSYARAVVGPGAEDRSRQLWRLCQAHLSGISPESRTRMLHGVGYGSGGARRATLYFRSWLEEEGAGTVAAAAGAPAAGPLRELLRAAGGHPGMAVEMIGYDFRGGRVERAKLYCRVRYEVAASMLAAAAPADPWLGAARGLLATFGEAAAERSRSSTEVHTVQLALHGGELTRKLFLPCGIWGWDTPDGFLGLLGELQGRLGVALAPLGSLLDGLIGSGIAISPSYVAVSGDQRTPSVTFYFSPDTVAGAGLAPGAPTAPATGARRRRAAAADTVDGMIAAGLEYVSGLQADDGLWRDYDVAAGTDGNGGRCQVEGPSTDLVSAYVGGCLAGLPAAGEAAGRAASALRERYRPGHGWGWNRRAPADAETTALAILLLGSVGLAPPDGAGEVLLRAQQPDGAFHGYPGRGVGEERSGAADVTAAAVLALLRSGRAGAGPTARAVRRLLELQDGAGAWRSVWWASDLVATARAVRALDGYAGAHPSDQGGQARAGVVRAAEALLGWPLPADPCSLGHWLLGWRAAGGGAGWATIHRVVAALRDQQNRDGSWPGAPNRRVPRRVAGRPGAAWDAATVVIDGGCLVTTAAVLAGLEALRGGVDGRDR